MSNICCLLDACTVINLIYIDEDDFLMKQLDKLDIHINDLVFTEIKQNVYLRLDENHISKYSDKKEIKRDRKFIDQKLAFFRSKKSDNGELLKDLGGDYFERIKKMADYSKKTNGELCSAAYALYLSRINSDNIFFYTDDYPATDHFSDFFNYQQIGQIKDSIDLLILLFWLDETFTERQLDKILSELHSQYASEIKFLKDKLQAFYDNKINGRFVKSNDKIAPKLKQLIFKLDKLEFQGINDLRNFFSNKKNKCSGINKIIENFYSVFELENSSNKRDLLTKIRTTRNRIKDCKIQKWGDLCS